MTPFPAFMRSRANRIATAEQHTPGVEGYLFDGADGSQMAVWTATADAVTEEHVHPFDEWFLVIEGSCHLLLDDVETHVGPGQECHIPRGTRIAGRVAAGTRTVHAFGGRRAERG